MQSFIFCPLGSSATLCFGLSYKIRGKQRGSVQDMWKHCIKVNEQQNPGIILAGLWLEQTVNSACCWRFNERIIILTNRDPIPPPPPPSALRTTPLHPRRHFLLSLLQTRRTCPPRSSLWWRSFSGCPGRRRTLRLSSSAARRLSRKPVREFAGQSVHRLTALTTSALFSPVL